MLIPPQPDRHAFKELQEISNGVSTAGAAADGAVVLGAHIMESAGELDMHRRSLARSHGPEMNKVFIEIEITAIEQAQKIQRSFGRRWSI